MTETQTAPPIPASLDSHKAFRAEARIAGEIAVHSLQRFIECLSDNTGQVSVTLRFYTDENWRRRIDGHIKVAVNVNCQRCLQPLPVVIEEDLHLAVVETEALAQRLPKEIDAWITAEQRLQLHDIIEEQLILGMPIVSRHPGDDCRMHRDGKIEDPRAPEAPLQGKQDNPFAVLARLKGDSQSGDNGSSRGS